MIVIDGHSSDMQVANFANLEELLVKVMGNEGMQDRVVTDVMLNEEPFSEIYPHQAEDIEASEISSVEIVTVPVGEMAVNITRELYKVVQILGNGARTVADLFRQADDMEALEMYQDMIQVVRDFLGMIGVLRSEFSLKDHQQFNSSVEEISDLFAEMTEVMENEDWVLLADLLEYEFLPAVDRWKDVIHLLREDIRDTLKG